MKGIVSKSTGSWYSVSTDDGKKVEARLRGKFKLKGLKITNPVAVGDRVVLEQKENDYIISEIEDRENYVVRVSPKKKGHSHLLAANIDQAVLIISYKLPRTSLGFVDRFLVSLEAFRIPGRIIINKADVYDEEEMNLVEEIKAIYEKIGYPTIITSFEKKKGGEVKEWFEGKLTLLSGHSGTGKSTLINHLIPNVTQDTQEVSGFADKGVHTTTFAEMFDLNKNSRIIDTPGIKELGLAEIDQNELSHYFPEMRAVLGSCKFHNCLHVNEPGCKVIQLLEEGKIFPSRFRSYLSMLEDEDNRR